MVTTEVFDKLKSLQDILAEKYSIESKIVDSPKRLSSQEELVARIKKEYIEKNAIYESVKNNVIKLRADLAAAEAKRENGEKGMDNITTHREYEALDKEIRDATENETNARKELQIEEKKQAELNEALKTAEQMIASSEAELNSGRENIEKETESLKNRLDELSKQEEELIPGIDSEIIFKFQRIIKSKQGKGIVAVKGNVCDGCHMILPAQFANEVHTGEKIVFCPYCSRILYYQELDSNDSEYFKMEDTGSLADMDDDFDDEEGDLDEEEGDSDNREEIKDMGFDD